MLCFETYRAAPDSTLCAHGHGAPHLVAIAKGEMSQRAGGVTREMGRGTFRVSAQGARHELTFGGEGAECLIIEAKGRFWRRIFRRALDRSSGADAFGVEAALSELGCVSSAGDLLARHNAVPALGAMLAVRPEIRPSWFDEAAELIEQNDCSRLAAIAERVRLGRVHFTRAFAAHCGFLPSEYRALRRLASAMRLISESSAPLAEVALACGYAHQSHMTNCFRAILGDAPSHWRR